MSATKDERRSTCSAVISDVDDDFNDNRPVCSYGPAGWCCIAVAEGFAIVAHFLAGEAHHGHRDRTGSQVGYQQ
ncbi:MAG: hypothetical protein ACPGVA_00515 [Pikeienuella sp.]